MQFVFYTVALLLGLFVLSAVVLFFVVVVGLLVSSQSRALVVFNVRTLAEQVAAHRPPP